MPKAVKKSTKSQSKKQDRKKKLPRGYKECSNCRHLLHIHKYVCDQCGHKHDMKKKKIDILKKLNKVTPKLLRSLIELNDFNEVEPPSPNTFNDFPLGKQEPVAPLQYKKKRSSKNSAIKLETQPPWTTSADRLLSYIKIPGHFTCLCELQNGVLIAESIEKIGTLDENEKITIRAYGLSSFHKVGATYTGKSQLLYFQNRKLLNKVVVNHHIMSLKAVANRVALLTGRGTIFIADFDTFPAKFVQPLDLESFPLMKANYDDQITTFEWLKAESSQGKIFIVAGTLMGHLHLFQIHQKQSQQIRFISNAHFEAVTSISECPLSNMNDCLFASGSYDGTLKIWSLHETEALYSMETSNRKICSLVWDSGAKFIFIVRDQNQDSGVLSCFFPVLKNDESITLGDAVDLRLIKNTSSCIALYSQGSTKFCLLDPYQGIIRVLQVEQLRKNSLKRKKVKKEDEESTYKLIFGPQGLSISQIELEDEQKEEPKMTEQYLPLPLIADAQLHHSGGKDYLWGISFNGYLFELILP